jgi:hypothetical protein
MASGTFGFCTAQILAFEGKSTEKAHFKARKTNGGLWGLAEDAGLKYMIPLALIASLKRKSSALKG